MQVRLRDGFGDFGMIGVAIARAIPLQTENWEIETWLMSCRVLGRKVEEAMLQEIAEAAKAAGASRLYGVYKPTAKNGMVAEHYSKLGFQPVEDEECAPRRFMLDLGGYRASELPMTVER